MTTRRSLPVERILSSREHDLDQPDEETYTDCGEYPDEPDPDGAYERRLERNGWRNE